MLDDDRQIGKIGMIAFTFVSLLMGLLAYCCFTPALQGLEFATFFFSTNGYSIPIPLPFWVAGWIYIFASISFLLAALWSFGFYLMSPGKNPDYEEYLYPSSEAKDNHTNSL